MARQPRDLERHLYAVSMAAGVSLWAVAVIEVIRAGMGL